MVDKVVRVEISDILRCLCIRDLFRDNTSWLFSLFPGILNSIQFKVS